MRFTLFSLFVLGCSLIAKIPEPFYQVLESRSDYIVVKFIAPTSLTVGDTMISGVTYQYIKGGICASRDKGQPWLPEWFVSVGIPFNSDPQLQIITSQTQTLGQKNILPYPGAFDSIFVQDIYEWDKNIYSANAYFPSNCIRMLNPSILRFAKILPIGFSPYQYNPVTRELRFISQVTLKIVFNPDEHNSLLYQRVDDDKFTDDLLKSSVINSSIAREFKAAAKIQSAENGTSAQWYDPTIDYYKVYVTKKGIQQINYNDLRTAGVSVPVIQSNSIQMYCNGVQIPIEIEDSDDGIFDQGDRIQFLGEPAAPSPYCTSNIYTNSNVYWLTVMGDPAKSSRYKVTSGKPTQWAMTYQSTARTDHYEKDLVFERLGHAPDGNRDYWLWDYASGSNGVIEKKFKAKFEPIANYNTLMPIVKFKIAFQGMTTFYCDYDHIAKVFINGKLVGIAQWNGQTAHLLEGQFYVHPDSVPIYPDGNYLEVSVDGNVCHPSKTDEVYVNWFEFSYQSDNRINGDKYQFKSDPSVQGVMRYWLWQWTADSMRVFVPATKRILEHPQFLRDADKTVWLIDSVTQPVEYYAVSGTNYIRPDSIVHDYGSDLRSPSNIADYIIITHRKFAPVAERLKALRSWNLSDSLIVQPKIIIAYIDDIYDEFSFGILDPYALQNFVRYAVTNWQGRKPSYVALIGDMSFDYRRILPASRPNYIPSIPYHSLEYGVAASDNGIVCVLGDDVLPDLAIGRLSIEEVSEGNVLLDKLEHYPSDNSKPWHETVLLLSSGLSLTDEEQYGFNEASIDIERGFTQGKGFKTKKIFRFPQTPEQKVYQGSTIEIRQAFNDGAVLANYYGHGGGYQWDATFLNDDIYLLQNGGRLPLIMSVTCYTAHFDNQDVFGEQFNKVPGKGSIGFFGSTGLTHWEVGKYINHLTFNEIFNNQEYVTGRAFMKGKAAAPPIGFYANQIALLTYLGDPALELAFTRSVDFAVETNDITTSIASPSLNDSVYVYVHYTNYGPVVGDSVTTRLYFTGADTSGLILQKRVKVFEQDSTIEYLWRPARGGLITLRAEINLIDTLPEPDRNDNTASIQVPVFNLSEPSIIYPSDGYSQSSGTITFKLLDLGEDQGKSLTYFFEIDTSFVFNNPMIVSQAVNPASGTVKWQINNLSNGHYYWRTRIFDGQNYGKWSQVRSFAVSTISQSGFFLSGDQLRSLKTENLLYSSAEGGMLLNKDLLPPKPMRNYLIKDIRIDDSVTFVKNGMTTIASDGQYLYIGNNSYFTALYYGDSLGRSHIYKVGTGFGGTIEGHNYGAIPNFFGQIRDQFCYHSDGNLYVPTEDAHRIVRINTSTLNNDTVTIPAGLIEYGSGTVRNGSFYLSSDSQYVYNIAYRDSNGNLRYSMRIFDPAQNWKVISTKHYELSSSYPYFCYFFVCSPYFYAYENYEAGTMRRIRLSDGVYDVEWLPWFDEQRDKTIRFYAWGYDWKNNSIFATVHRPGLKQAPKVSRFPANYIEAKGTLATPAIGPARYWKKVAFDPVPGLQKQNISSLVEGYDKNRRSWDTLFIFSEFESPLSFINVNQYNFIRTSVTISDSSANSTSKIGVRSLHLDFEPLPELTLIKNSFAINPDTVIQGASPTLQITVKNESTVDADSMTLKSFINNTEERSVTRDIKKDSSFIWSYPMNTINLPAGTASTVKVSIEPKIADLFDFNNVLTQTVFVRRDTTNPQLAVTVDGVELESGDILPPQVTINFKLKDNTALPFDTNAITIRYNNRRLSYKFDSLSVVYMPFPNSEMNVAWKATLKKGRDTIDIRAKDPSGNYYSGDSTYLRYFVNVYTEDQLLDVYNYPNPFSDGTNFTFQIRGKEYPQSVGVKIYTVAGRLIKEIETDVSKIHFGMNYFYWDGKDQDGSEIANGTYLYKLICRYSDKSLTQTQKLVKMR